MGTTKNLHLLMTADGKQQEQALGKTEAMLAKLKHAVGGFGGLLGIGAGVLSAEGIVHSMERGLDQIVEMKHAADSLGISMNRIAGIKFAAGANWEGAEAGIGKMLKNLGDAQLGSTEAARGFHLLDLEVDNLKDLKTEESLGQIIDRLKAIENPAQRAYVASQIFGKGWQAMIPLIEKGSAGLEEARKSAGEITEEMARDAARTKRDLKELGEAWDSFWRKRAANFAAGRDKPIYKPGTTQLLTNDEWKKMREEREPLSAAETRTPQDIAKADAANKLAAEINALQDKLSDEQAALQGAGAEVDAFARKHAEATPEMLATARSIEEGTKALKDQEKWAKETAHHWEEIFKNGRQLAEDSAGPLTKFRDKLFEIEEAFELQSISADEYARSVAHLVDQFDKLDKVQDHGPGALVEGSAEAFSATEKFHRAGEDADKSVADKVDQTMEKMRLEEKRTGDIADKILQRMRERKEVRF